MRTDNLSNESEKKLNILHNNLVDYHSQHNRPVFPEELDGIDGFDLLFKLLLDKDYIKLDSIYFDMNKEEEG